MRSLAVLTFVLLAAAPPTRAGDRRLYILLVNMTPDAQSSDASKKCVRAVEKKLAADYTEITKLGETPLRKLVGKTAGEPFQEWPAEAFEPAKRRGDTYFDAAILVDCRPEERRVEAVVHPASGGLAAIRLRGPELDRAATDLVADAILRRAWIGFSP